MQIDIGAFVAASSILVLFTIIIAQNGGISAVLKIDDIGTSSDFKGWTIPTYVFFIFLTLYCGNFLFPFKELCVCLMTTLIATYVITRNYFSNNNGASVRLPREQPFQEHPLGWNEYD